MVSAERFQERHELVIGGRDAQVVFGKIGLVVEHDPLVLARQDTIYLPLVGFRAQGIARKVVDPRLVVEWLVNVARRPELGRRHGRTVCLQWEGLDRIDVGDYVGGVGVDCRREQSCVSSSHVRGCLQLNRDIGIFLLELFVDLCDSGDSRRIDPGNDLERARGPLVAAEAALGRVAPAALIAATPMAAAAFNP